MPSLALLIRHNGRRQASRADWVLCVAVAQTLRRIVSEIRHYQKSRKLLLKTESSKQSGQKSMLLFFLQ